MTSLELIDEIEELIMMHQEGSYWDFKREWYDDSKDGDLLIDIISGIGRIGSLYVSIIIM